MGLMPKNSSQRGGSVGPNLVLLEKRVESGSNQSHVMHSKRHMNLEQGTRDKVVEWISQGAKLSEIQGRLASEYGLRLTYMEVRFLVDDLKLTPKDAEPAKPTPTLAGKDQKASPEQTQADRFTPAPGGEPEEAPGGGQVRVSVDQLARPGAMVSGKVTFSDGKSGQWYLDHTGRLGLVPPEPGYRPSPMDVQAFQSALETELSRMGM